MTCFAGNTISYRRWIIGVRDCFFNDVISTMVTRHGCNITGTLHSSCWGFRRQKRRLNFGERQNDSRKLKTAIQNLAHAKPVNAKYLILNINHQSSFTDVNNYLPKDLDHWFVVVGARFLLTVLAVQSTEIKIQSFFSQITSKKISTLTVTPVVWKKYIKIIFSSREGYLSWWSENPSIRALRDFCGL